MKKLTAIVLAFALWQGVTAQNQHTVATTTTVVTPTTTTTTGTSTAAPQPTAAQTAGTQQAVTQPTVTTQPTVPPPPAIIRVDSIRKFNTAVWIQTHKWVPRSMGGSVYIGNYIIVSIHKEDMLAAVKISDQLRIWMGGVCYTNMKPLYINQAESFMVFKLERDTSAQSPWQLFYTWPNYWDFSKQVDMNLGTTTIEYAQPGRKHRLCLHTSYPWVTFVFYPLFILLLFLLYRWPRAKGMLRDVGMYARNGVKISYTKDTNADDGIINIRDIPFSLARFQFLFWLLIIFFGILHIWIITDNLISPSARVLLLIGISGGTMYIGKVLDTQPPSTPDTRTPKQIVTDFIAKNLKSKGFMADILSDGNSTSLHRLQLLIFTVFLGIYFVIEVFSGLLLPEFSDTMMGLMGISSIMYAGVKTTEQNV